MGAPSAQETSIIKRNKQAKPFIENWNTYESYDVVEYYARYVTLEPPEQAILNLLRNKLPAMSMLDIGVGGGRTTKYFAPLTREYIGVDYAHRMIRVCRRKFPEFKFEVADVRNLSMFEDNYFDFTLFSNNGLDYISHEDRIQALKEMRRVTKIGGYVCMSTHNLNYFLKLFKFNFPNMCYGNLRLRWFSRKPRELFSEVLRTRRFRCKNSNLAKNAANEAYLFFNDGAHKSGLITYYVKPGVQVQQLEKTGFRSFRIFGTDGEEVIPADLMKTSVFHLYFLAQ